jgi:ATP-dependent helicase/nuclease subunit A
MLVEAAAGTGKTTIMVARMIALLREGHCTPATLAAVTFTRKAAAELKGRFAAGLAKAAREAQADGSDAETERLDLALERIDQIFIGTIHSFCSRLLRERPVEAGVDPGFGELAEDADVRYRKEAWARYMDQAGPDDPVLGALSRSGVTLGDLTESFVDYCRYQDLDRWPYEPGIQPPDLATAKSALDDYMRHVERLLPELPRDPGNDKLIPRLRRIYRMKRRLPEGPASLFSILAEITPEPKIIHKMWPGRKEQAVAEQERHTRLAERYAVPAMNQWLAYRYALVMEAFAAAARIYDDIRAESGGLNFQDLLMSAAGLLRDKPAVREYFKARFTHLLVDEFQDTDPVQAQVMMLLTADNVNETDWTRCTPEPGSLFVVGDPKQSIYRFRRADVVVYETVKGILCGPGNPPAHLFTSFRSAPELISWVNDRFTGPFGELSSPYSPDYVALKPGPGSERAELTGIERLDSLSHLSNKELIHDFETGAIASDIRSHLDAGRTVPGSGGPAGPGPVPCRPGDFMVVTAYTHQLGLYGSALQEMGIPHQVTGGSGLSAPPELGMLAACFKAVLYPEDSVALLAVLRGGLFGLTDQELYEYALAGGTFNYRKPVPEGLCEGTAESFTGIYGALARFRSMLAVMSPVAAISSMAEELGLIASAAAGENGNLMAGSLLKALELLRGDLRDRWSPEDLLTYLQQLANGEEKHDGVTAVPPAEKPARVMNLHKVKGLEAPVVYLADPTGNSDREPSIHINRSGKEVTGYMKVLGPSRGFMPRDLLARPLDWEELAAEEQKFADAEELRRLYVAATRAGSRLVVSQRVKGEKSNPWLFFKDGLEEAPSVEVSEEDVEAPPESTGPAIEPGAVEKAREQIAAAWQEATGKSYDKLHPSSYGVEGEIDRRRPAEEDAAKRGTVIHGLLEAAMTNPEADLDELARSLCANQELDAEKAAEYARTARKVTESKEWTRAQKAKRLFTEIPYTRSLENEDVETLETGVIDLVFEEEEGWVIVDYKTTKAAKGELGELAEHYRPQLEAYSKAWNSFGEGEVKEIGIFWVDHKTYDVL